MGGKSKGTTQKEKTPQSLPLTPCKLSRQSIQLSNVFFKHDDCNCLDFSNIMYVTSTLTLD